MKKKLTKLILLFLVIFAIMAAGTTATAAPVVRYATKTVALQQKKNKKFTTVYRVKRNTKLRVTKQWKVRAQVRYKNKILYVRKAYLHRKKSPKKYTGKYMRRAGVIRWGGCLWTYYSQRVLPGRGLRIPGRHVDSQGFVCDKDNYIVIASSVANKKKKTIVPTPFGKYGKCYDCGGGGNNWRDLYVAW